MTVARWIGATVSTLVLAIVAAVAAELITSDERSIPRPAAAEFLIHYWDLAVRAPELTWPLLDEKFRSDIDYTYDEYTTFMSGFERIEASRIRESGRRNYFEVTLTYVPARPGAPPVVEHLTFGLRCEWADSHLPYFECDPDELTIIDGYFTR